VRRFETLRDLLPKPRGLVRTLGPVVQTLMVAVHNLQPNIFVRCRVAFEQDGDQYTGLEAALSEQFVLWSLGSATIPPALSSTCSTMSN
jgi:hypothetical protein